MSRTFNLTFHKKPLRGESAINIALVGIPNSGKSTLFEAVSSTQPSQATLTGTQQLYRQCMVEVGLNEVSLIDLPSIQSLHHQQGDELVTLKYLLWGDQRPLVSRHESPEPPHLMRQLVCMAEFHSLFYSVWGAMYRQYPPLRPPPRVESD